LCWFEPKKTAKNRKKKQNFFKRLEALCGVGFSAIPV
jgi:hypothetical protein